MKLHPTIGKYMYCFNLRHIWQFYRDPDRSLEAWLRQHFEDDVL